MNYPKSKWKFILSTIICITPGLNISGSWFL